ncbi:hypothetical protein DEU56DRAFT_467286 [Suillus clintonianus]|uniref:uncharacterized protein n=1 Tax=Suillus clintonianus TaxID=1904413 RepID=UPI001B868EBF|nr:uncharacterized protein DEU56DRAFT_467286 [Suillus clintonianus]KAG2130352.1 hypothetical protein DEU56DRAFT_467286 [Suillus clintonianus]
MFSSFSSFLPSVLQPNQEQRSHHSLSTPNQDTPEPDVNSQPVDYTAGDPKSKKKDKREKLVNETFIVVRPPPSKSNHPLNLQVQLVPPQSRHDRPHATVQALDQSAPDISDSTSDSTDLRRTPSGQSEASTTSGYTSATSISSFNSSSTTSSGRRMIIPLYNLQAHNVMTNVIVDAGTDAKVAKFAKRGLEILGLAILEPIEVWGTVALPGGALPPSSSARTSVDDSKRELGLFPRPRTHSSSSRPVTPDSQSTALSLPSHTDIPRKPSFTLSPAATEEPITSNAQPQRGGAKKLFTKMFKKKDASSRMLAVVPTAAVEVQGLQSIARLAARRSHDIPPPSSSQVADVPRFNDNLPHPSVSGTSSTVILCPPVLGIQASLYPPTSPPKGRPTKYVWVVRKWLKGTDTGLLNGMMGKLSANGRGDLGGASAPQVEVRFEWSRGLKKEKERGRKSRTDRRSPAQGPESGSVSRRGSAVVTSEPPLSRSVHKSPSRSCDPPSGPDASPTSHCRSRFSHHSASSDASTSIESSAHRADDSGDDSEPEDSETPWTCTLTVQRIGHPPSMHRSAEQRDHVVRLKVATLAPTPHHPKVVGLLKVPFPLPDIEVERLAVHRRVVTTQGVNRTASSSGELTLTAEEIKDSISSTALWLVVREAFGGVGRERRKGDGWRIRA